MNLNFISRPFPVTLKLRNLHMKTKLTFEESRISRALRSVKGYPRWKRTSITGGFLYYLNPFTWVEEVFQYFDGAWSAGRKSKGTLRHFNSLQEALAYGAELAVPKVKKYNARQMEIQRMARTPCRVNHILPCDSCGEYGNGHHGTYITALIR
jgi:hypothetical protein